MLAGAITLATGLADAHRPRGGVIAQAPVADDSAGSRGADHPRRDPESAALCAFATGGGRVRRPRPRAPPARPAPHHARFRRQASRRQCCSSRPCAGRTAERLSDTTRRLLRSMITVSDNDAASAVYAQVGGEGLRRVAARRRHEEVHRRRALGRRPDHGCRPGPASSFASTSSCPRRTGATRESSCPRSSRRSAGASRGPPGAST